MKSAAMTISGRRQANQDAFCAEPQWGLYVVADGMGGYQGGEVAAATAVETIREFFRANEEDDAVTWPFGLRKDLCFAQNLVRVAVRTANQAVMAKRKGDLASMGSTVVVLAWREGRVVLGHVGDSRVYRIRDGVATQLTQDHSLYNELLAAGSTDLPPQKEFAYKNIVTRALGFTVTAGDEPDVAAEAPRAGDVYLLSTDGLHDVLDDAQVAAIVASSKSLDDACTRLVAAAYEGGSHDNITALLVEIEPSDDAVPFEECS